MPKSGKTTVRGGKRTATGSGSVPPSRSSGGKMGPSSPSSRFSPALLRAAVSALVSRSRFSNMAGLTHPNDQGGYNRDLYVALGYNRNLGYDAYYSRYLRGGIAQRIVEAYPLATWTDGVFIQEDPDPTHVTEFEKAVEALFTRLDVWNRIMRVDILSGIGHYGALLIGAPGELDQPLPTITDPDKQLLYLTPLSEDCALINSFDSNPKSPRFGQPEFYDVKLGQDEGTTGKAAINFAQRVHHSRMIHVAEGLLKDDVYGKPRLRAPWNYLDDLEKIVGGGAEAAWKRMDPGMQIDVDPELELSPADEEDFDDEVDDYVHGVSRIMRTRGTKVNLLSTTVSGFGPNADSVIQLLSATTGIPYRILIGSERGELSSNQDRNNWADRVAERRRSFATPFIRTLISKFIEIGALPKPTQFEMVWPRVEEMDEVSKAQILSSIAAANNNQVSAEGVPILLSDEIRDTLLGLKPLSPEVRKKFEAIIKARSSKGKDQSSDGSADKNSDPESDSDAGSDRGDDDASE